MQNKFAIYGILMLILVMLFQACTKDSEISIDCEWSFVVIGDVRQGYGIYGLHAKHIAQLHTTPDAAFCLGDIMLRPGNEVEWESFWQASEPITKRMPLYLVRGNHEGNDPECEEIFSEQSGRTNGLFYYSLDLYNTACIILDTEVKGEEGSIGSQQFYWLTNKLSNIINDSLIDHIFIFLHRPVFSFGEDMGSQLENAEYLHELFILNEKVKVVFAGHDHIYHRQIKDGLNYIITCGGGEPLFHGVGGDYYHFVLVSFKEHNINIKTIDLFNEIIEDYDI